MIKYEILQNAKKQRLSLFGEGIASSLRFKFDDGKRCKRVRHEPYIFGCMKGPKPIIHVEGSHMKTSIRVNSKSLFTHIRPPLQTRKLEFYY